MKLRGYIFPVLMCLLTLATALRYHQVSESGRVYHFVVRTDEDGLSRIRKGLADADIQGVGEDEVDSGLYRITVRCNKEKLSLLWSIFGGRSEK